MSIIGITHDESGNAKVRRSVTTKLAIGLPPEGSRNYPTKLDHIAFLKKVYLNKEIKWVPDEQLTNHYGNDCRELWVTFFDDDIETVFPTAYRAYVTRGCWCRGDGAKAERRLNHEKEWNDFVPYGGKCANNGCPVAANGGCKPNGTLYFFLQDFPKLGSLCKLQTTGYQSIAQLYSALQDLRAVTGGRLMGVSAKLFVHPDKTVFESQGKTQTGMKWVWGLELAAADLKDMGSKMLEGTRTFREIKGELAGRVLEIDEDEQEVAQEMRSEFYPDQEKPRLPAAAIEADPRVDQLLVDEIHGHLTSVGINQANRTAIIGANQPRLKAANDDIKQILYIYRATGEAMKAGEAIKKNERRLGDYAKELTAWYERKKSNGNGSAAVAPSSNGQQPAEASRTGATNGSGDARPAAGQDALFVTDEDTQPAQQPTVAQCFGGAVKPANGSKFKF